MIKESYEEIIEMEKNRQKENVELIASENFPSERVLKAAGSILTNKYAEGYSGRRYYGGCKYIDMIETKAIEDVCKLFDCKYANVQPHSGSSANLAVYRALINPGDVVLGMSLDAGGHLTHGYKMSFSGQDYEAYSYGVDENGYLDNEEFKKLLYEHNPRLIIIGASSYSRTIDYKLYRDIIDEYAEKHGGEKPYYMVDMAHVAGLIAGGVHPSPIPYADVVTSTTHKTLRGPRGGIILTNSEDIIKKINKTGFPGIQGGPLEHIIAAKGICFEEDAKPEFKEYAKQIIKNAKAFSEEFIKNGWKVISGGTDNHMFVLDVYTSCGLSGKDVEVLLDDINITLNKNQIPNDTLPPLKSSGVRIGTPAMTTKGWKEDDFIKLAHVIMDYLKECQKEKTGDSIDTVKESTKEKYKKEVQKIVKK